MNKIRIIISLLCLFAVTGIWAQKKEYKGNMQVTPLQLEQRGDSLYINIDFDISDVKVGSLHSISLIPTLVAPDNEKALPTVMVKGRVDFLTSRREVALMSKAERELYNQNAPYAILKGYKNKDSKKLLYSKTIPFESWMKDARLDIREDLCGCGNPPRSLAVSQIVERVELEPVVLPYEVMPHLAYIQPAVEAIKKREMASEAFLDFVVSKIDIRPEYMNNPRELKRITNMVEEVQKDANIIVKGISVIGYASPEGTLKFNKYLSEGRANALVSYLRPRFDYPKEMYHIEFGGENWSGLRAMLDTVPQQDKEQIIAILDNQNIDNETRKNQLKWLNGGVPYINMVKRYYPSLRKAICKIEYEVKGFDVVEAKEVFKTHPQNLSLNEMFLVANTYESGSAEFINLFETAVRMFPADETANLNAALAALSRKDSDTAERYLTKVKTPSAEWDNAMGVLLMLRGEYDTARVHFVKAQEKGLSVATENITELNRKIENIKNLNK